MNTYRWQRRENKLQAKKNKMPKHGKDVGIIYKNAWGKRVSEEQV